MTTVNWTNDDCFEARDSYIAYRDGRQFKIKLYPSGWALHSRINGEGPDQLDIFTLRYILNTAEATTAS